MELYYSLGIGYGDLRRPDPRIGARIDRVLGDSQSIVNVGAGTGSYEPRDRRIVAVEPSMVMVRQRPEGASPAVRASASELPFRDATFDTALAILTIHHWPDLASGLAELCRAARRTVVLLTFDTAVGGFWLTDYFPEILEIDRRTMPSFSELRRHLGAFDVFDVPVPHDCIDGFLGAYWRRPHAYLEGRVRAAISVFAGIEALETGIERLRDDLRSGVWEQRFGELLERTELDLGYRLVVARQ